MDVSWWHTISYKPYHIIWSIQHKAESHLKRLAGAESKALAFWKSLASQFPSSGCSWNLTRIMQRHAAFKHFKPAEALESLWATSKAPDVGNFLIWSRPRKVYTVVPGASDLYCTTRTWKWAHKPSHMITKPIKSPMTASTKKKTPQIGPSRLANWLGLSLRQFKAAMLVAINLPSIWAYWQFEPTFSTGSAPKRDAAESTRSQRGQRPKGHSIVSSSQLLHRQTHTPPKKKRRTNPAKKNASGLPKLVPHLNIWTHSWWEIIESSHFSSRDIDANAC